MEDAMLPNNPDRQLFLFLILLFFSSDAVHSRCRDAVASS